MRIWADKSFEEWVFTVVIDYFNHESFEKWN